MPMDITIETFRDPTTFSANVKAIFEEVKDNDKLSEATHNHLYRLLHEFDRKAERTLFHKVGVLMGLLNDYRTVLRIGKRLEPPYISRDLPYYQDRVVKALKELGLAIPVEPTPVEQDPIPAKPLNVTKAVVIYTSGTDTIIMWLDTPSPFPFPELATPVTVTLEARKGYGVEWCRTVLGIEPQVISG